MNFILFLKELTPPFLWKIFKKLKKKQKYFGLYNLDIKLEKYLNYNNGYFIELGANNGVEQSNTFYFEKEKNWTGILIEPILHKYLDCKKIAMITKINRRPLEDVIEQLLKLYKIT